MHNLVGKNWWTFLVRGIIAIIFGLAVMYYPLLTLQFFAIFFGAFAFVDGCFALGAAFTANASKNHDRWILVLQGILGILIGLITLVVPAATVLGLLIVIAAWFLTIGILQIVAAIRLRKQLPHQFLLALVGILSVVCGLLIAAYPGAGAISIAWVVGLYAIIVGVALVIFGFRARSLGKKAAAY